MQFAKKQLNKSAGEVRGTGNAISSAWPTGENVPPTDDNTAVAQRLAVFVPRDGAITVARLIDHYMSQYAGRDSSRAQRLRFWAIQLGDLALRDLSDDHVFHALEELKATRPRYFAGLDADGKKIFKAKRDSLRPATINRVAAALSAVVTWAVKRRIAPPGFQNPVSKVGRQAENNEIVRFLSSEERRALLEECKKSSWPKLYAFVLLALTSGGRRGELEGLRWADIDFDRREAAVARSKNGDKKTLILVPAVLEALSQFRGPASSLVFASRRRPDVAFNHVGAWQAALKRAGVKRFRFHDLRHSCASALAQSGATLLEIADVLGHRNLSVTKRYSHLTTTHKAELINRVLGGIR
jgi:integrase